MRVVADLALEDVWDGMAGEARYLHPACPVMEVGPRAGLTMLMDAQRRGTLGMRNERVADLASELPRRQLVQLFGCSWCSRNRYGAY